MTDAFKDELTDEEKAAEAEMQAEPEVEEEASETESEPPEPEKPEAKVEVEPEKPAKPDGFVPIGALHEAREKNKAAEGENAELRRQLQELQLAVVQMRQPQQPDEMPDPITDPEAFKGWMGKKMQAERAPVEQLRQQQEANVREQQRIAELTDYANSHEDAFRRDNPKADYNGALEFMVDLKRREFEMLGMPPARIEQELRNLRIGTVEMARQNGWNPAAYVYNMARLYGFNEKPPEVQNPASQVERLAAAQQQTQSLAGASGKPRDDELTLARVAAMSEKEIAALDDDQLRELYG